ncbi:MAG: PspC domain-containing protein [Prevotella sp.]|jgi:phage shock protein C
MANGKKLVRSKSNKILAGVIGGLAEYMNIDPTLARILYAVLTVCTAFSGVILYLILWMVIPEDK